MLKRFHMSTLNQSLKSAAAVVYSILLVFAYLNIILEVNRMTSDFDYLMEIRRLSRENPKLKPLADWLRDICVGEADMRKPSWNFRTWKESEWGRLRVAVYGEDDAKWWYLDDCHEILDHRGFHLKVFTPETRELIRIVHDLINGGELNLQDSKRRIKRHLPKLLELIRAYGTVEEGNYIRLNQKTKT